MSDQQENKNDWKERECGALWSKTSAGGNAYSSGYVTVDGERVNIMILRNTHKQEGEKTPDARIYLSEVKSSVTTSSNGQSQQVTSSGETVEDDGIPF
jgi:uncharacterized protein (DUF736 family)